MRCHFVARKRSMNARCTATVKNIVPLYQQYCENNLQNSIVVGWLQYFGYNAHCTKGKGGGEGTIIPYNPIVKIIYNL